MRMISNIIRQKKKKNMKKPKGNWSQKQNNLKLMSFKKLKNNLTVQV
jgi:hypothetical protein